jgi:AcrR family transcriptional regulator
MAGKAKSSTSDDRRDQVAQATWRVIAREGLDRASMRAIAQELGCTTGVLTHYFRDKDALLDFAFTSIVSRLNVSPAQGAILNLDDVQAIMSAFLPTSADAKTWWRVWLSFTVAALSNEKQAASHAKLYAELRKFWTMAFTALQAHGRISKDLQPANEAETILCLVDGIGVQALISPRTLTARRQVELIEAYLDKLTPARGG